MTVLVTDAQLDSLLNLDGDTTHLAKARLYASALTDYVDERFGALPSDTRTDELTVVDGRMWTRRFPLLTVTNAVEIWPDQPAYTTGATFSADFVIASDARSVSHPQITYGRWRVTYTFGWADTPAQLQLAALLDIQALYQASQIGAPGALEQFDITAGDVAPGGRPVHWPRVDSWLARHQPPAIG